MPHLSQHALRRVLSAEAGTDSTDLALQHLLRCTACRSAAAGIARRLRESGHRKAEGKLGLILALLDEGQAQSLDSLRALAERAGLRPLSPRAQRDQVRMAKSCHSPRFFEVLLKEFSQAATWQEAELTACLALESAKRMTAPQVTGPEWNDLQARVWIDLANERRKAAEWEPAGKALRSAESLLREGTGDPLLEARLLSIRGSLQADTGLIGEAVETLERCRRIYAEISEWREVAHTLVKWANILAGTQPLESLALISQARPLIPSEDSFLALHAALLTVDCLIETEHLPEALQAFGDSQKLQNRSDTPRLTIRRGFVGARLMHAFGLTQEVSVYRLPPLRPSLG